ncbi:MAG TPA: DUF6599 family protein [Bryobacteraceae bacterium]|nr:DUF6599 family protein [Bryobacteraceae bacterium]
MIQRAAFLFLLPALAFSAILPDTIGEWKRGDVTAAPAPDAKVWNEYGLQESENAPYTGPAAKKFSITAYRFSDSTGAFAGWIGSRPPDAKKFETDGIGVETAKDQYIAVGNLLLIFHGYKPNKEELAHIFLTAPHYSHSPLPGLPGYLPAGAVPNSERYILGPESLARYAGVIPPSTAAFHFSSEAETADYEAPAGAKGAGKDRKTTIVVFNFPGIEMAQKQYPAFEAIPGTVAKRSGPLVAIALHPVNPDEAERLLARVRYEAEVTMAEPPPTLKNNAGNLLLNIAILCGVLITLCLAGGLVFGGMRYVFRRSDSAGGGEEMISLHLSGKS